MKYTYAVGRRKTASAQVRLYEGSKDSKINEKNVNDYVKDEIFWLIICSIKIMLSKR